MLQARAPRVGARLLTWRSPRRLRSGRGRREVVPAAADRGLEVVERVGQAWVRVAERLVEGGRTEPALADHGRDRRDLVALAAHERLVDRTAVARHDHGAP